MIKKVVDAYTTLRGQIAAGMLGEEGTPRRLKAECVGIRQPAPCGHVTVLPVRDCHELQTQPFKARSLTVSSSDV